MRYVLYLFMLSMSAFGMRVVCLTCEGHSRWRARVYRFHSGIAVLRGHSEAGQIFLSIMPDAIHMITVVVVDQASMAVCSLMHVIAQSQVPCTSKSTTRWMHIFLTPVFCRVASHKMTELVMCGTGSAPCPIRPCNGPVSVVGSATQTAGEFW